MVGTFASLFEKNPKTSTQELLRFALAGACATLESPGTSLGSKHAILKKMKSVRIVKA
jgi:fructose-1-phosphate kinase PfkB-like protein